MNARQKIVVMVFLLSLSACADTKWPTWITGEPDDSVINAPRIVRDAPSQDEQTWPSLASVPPRPKDFSTTNFRKNEVMKMQDDTIDANRIKQEVEGNNPTAGAGAQ